MTTMGMGDVGIGVSLGIGIGNRDDIDWIINCIIGWLWIWIL